MKRIGFDPERRWEMKTRNWLAAGTLGLALMAIPAETSAAHRVVAAPGVRVSVTPRFYYGPRPVVHAAPRVVAVRPVNYGSVDFNVEPQKSKVFVDGKYLGIADDFNGYPQTAKLSVGYHDIRVVAPDGRTEHRRIYVAAGQEFNFNLNF